MKNFDIHLEETDLKKEKNIARRLKQSQWWKRQKDKGICHYCKQRFSPKELTMDHIVPISKGGKSSKGNIVTSCKECNNKKKEKLLMEWDFYIK